MTTNDARKRTLRPSSRARTYTVADQIADAKVWLSKKKDKPMHELPDFVPQVYALPPISKELSTKEMSSDPERLKELINLYKQDIAEYKFKVELLQEVIENLRKRQDGTF